MQCIAMLQMVRMSCCSPVLAVHCPGGIVGGVAGAALAALAALLVIRRRKKKPQADESLELANRSSRLSFLEVSKHPNHNLIASYSQ